VVPQDRDTLFMDALVESGTVLTTFVGHDHGTSQQNITLPSLNKVRS